MAGPENFHFHYYLPEVHNTDFSICSITKLPSEIPRLKADSPDTMMEAGFSGYRVNMIAMPVVHCATSESPMNNLENEIVFTRHSFYRITIY